MAWRVLQRRWQGQRPRHEVSRSNSARRRDAMLRGFTLVEVLVVVLIISALVAILIPTVQGVLRRAENFRYSAELTNLQRAFEMYKEKYGDYPPTFADVNPALGNAAVPWDQSRAYRHISKVFQRIDPSEKIALGLFVTNPDTHIDPAEAIVFWTGGLSANPKFPFTGAGGPLAATGDTNRPLAWRVQERHEPLYTFNEDRLLPETIGNYIVGVKYLPPGNQVPYVYFDHHTYSFVDANGLPNYAYYAHTSPLGGGITRIIAYKSATPNTTFNPVAGSQDSILRDNELFFVNRDTFQIICAGRDGDFGPLLNSISDLTASDPNGNPVPIFTVYPTFQPYHPSHAPTDTNFWSQQPQVYFNKGQEDNLTNFSNGQTLESAVP